MDSLLGRALAAVVFDLDGTLVDSTGSVVRSWTRWAQEEGVPLAALDGSHGRPAAEIAASVLPADRVAAAVARIEAIELADTDGVVPLPGAVAALAALPDGRAAVATSCTRSLAAARIAASGLVAPGVVVTVDDVSRGKPAPDPFLLAAERLGVDPRRCLVVEDAPAGLRGARAAGCATLAVTTTHPADELDADVVVATLADVRLRVAGAGAGVEVCDVREGCLP